MVAADSERGDARLREQREMRLDVLVAALQRVARAEGHVAYVRDLEVDQGRRAHHMVHRPDALHGAHGAGPESRARAVGDAEVHRHAADRHVEAADVRQSGRVRPVGRAAEGGDVGEGPFAPLALELPCGHAREGRIGDVAAAGVGELPAQALEFRLVQGRPPLPLRDIDRGARKRASVPRMSAESRLRQEASTREVSHWFHKKLSNRTTYQPSRDSRTVFVINSAAGRPSACIAARQDVSRERFMKRRQFLKTAAVGAAAGAIASPPSPSRCPR